jgi:hypothetical protein
MIYRRDRSLSAAAHVFLTQIRQVAAAVEKTLPPLAKEKIKRTRKGSR